MQDRNEKIIKIFLAFCFFVSVLIIRLIYLQVQQKNKFSTLGEKNFLRTEKIAPLRGNIVDLNGKLLASNRPVYDIYWRGLGAKIISSDQKKILQIISKILEQDFLTQEMLKRISYINRSSKRLLLKPDITYEQLCLILEQCGGSYNLDIESRFQRVYPYKKLASHILGYLSRQIEDFTTKGISGLESMFQDSLKGEVGHVLNVINSNGTKIDQVEFCEPKQGNDLRLTIDLNLQYIAEQAFNDDLVGAFILMDPRNGSIKSLVSLPNYDPNIFLHSISYKQWNKEFVAKNSFLNRATSATYPPASIFKLVTFAAGLEEGIITKDEEFDCLGFINFHGRRYHCIRHWGHGKLNSKNALAYSCNIPCYEMAQKMNINSIADYAFRFGLGKKTGFLLKESSGLVPTIEWKVMTKGERWWPGETLSASIGQSYISVTPLQMARMISAIVTGYLVRPRILQDEDTNLNELHISENTLNFLREAMKGVVEKGSAKLLNKFKDFDIYAKTGTAQTSSLSVKNKSNKYLEHAWLASYFSYKGEDPLVMIVLVEHVGSSVPAREIAATFLNSYKRLRENRND